MPAAFCGVCTRLSSWFTSVSDETRSLVFEQGLLCLKRFAWALPVIASKAAFTGGRIRLAAPVFFRRILELSFK